MLTQICLGTLLAVILAAPVQAALLDDLLAYGSTSAEPAANGTRGVQVTPDQRYVLVNADVGNERWAIALDELNVVTGNIFFTTAQPPVFLWCVISQVIGQIPNATIVMTCTGANRCPAPGGCPQFQVINDNVRLPATFFLP
jgi:hypothetical protein